MHGNGDSERNTQYQQNVDAYIAGDKHAADKLYSLLLEPVKNSVIAFFGTDNKDCDDVVQETLLAVLAYLNKHQAFTGSIRSFATTIARNRCRDILRSRKAYPHQPIEPLTDWIADHGKSALDYLTETESQSLVHQAMAQLSDDCRSLIKALYFGGQSMDALRLKFGLKSVQAMYYRRDICLQNILKIFKNRLDDRSLLEGGGYRND